MREVASNWNIVVLLRKKFGRPYHALSPQPMASIMFRLSSCENNRYPCQHEILHHQHIVSHVSVISKSGSPSCANFPFPIYLSEASVDLFRNPPFVCVECVYNHLLGLKTQKTHENSRKGFDRTGSHRSLIHLLFDPYYMYGSAQ